MRRVDVDAIDLIRHSLCQPLGGSVALAQLLLSLQPGIWVGDFVL